MEKVNVGEVILFYVIAFLLPPLAVFLKGSKKQFVCNIILCFLFWIPGIIHAIKLINTWSKESAEDSDISGGVNYQTDKVINTPKYTSKKFSVAGTSFRQKELKSLASKNEYFKMQKNELIEDGLTDVKIYEYDFNITKPEIAMKTDDDEFPGSLRVIANGVHIGYIKKDDVDRVKNILSEGNISLKIFIGGGKYKCYYDNSEMESEIEDLESDDDVKRTIKTEKGEIDFFARITLQIPNKKKQGEDKK